MRKVLRTILRGRWARGAKGPLFVTILSCVSTALVGVSAGAAAPEDAFEPQKRVVSWTSKVAAEAPAAVHYAPEDGDLFVSMMAGGRTEKDGKAWIQKLEISGTMVGPKWMSGGGLNSPKGMDSHEGQLWVADIDEVHVIDIDEGKIRRTLTVADAKSLHDVAITSGGRVFVSDPVANRIFEIAPQGTGGEAEGKGRKPRISSFGRGKSLESPKGLHIKNGSLVVAGWAETGEAFSAAKPGSLYTLDLESGKKERVSEEGVGRLDGLAVNRSGHYVVSEWQEDRIVEVTPKGKMRTLVDGLKGPGGIEFLKRGALLIVPETRANQITAYDFSTPTSEEKRSE